MERVNDFATLRKLPQYLLTVVMIISLMMLIEITVENVHLFRARKKVAAAEDELLKLKAKLYDKSDTEPVKAITKTVDDSDEGKDEEEDEDEKEDDYLLDDEKKD